MGVSPVLVVDDDAVSRHVLCQALASVDLPYVAVASGTEALAQAAQVKPSLVLLDLVMPPPDGYQVLRILRSQPETRDVPVVVLTGVDAEGEVAKAFEAGADDFVRKPFRPVELVARIRGQLRLRGMIEELARKDKDGQVVLELTQALASNLDFRGILFTVVQRIAEVVKVDRVSIVLVRENGNVGYVVAASDDAHLRDLPIELARYPEIRHVLKSGEALVVEDAAAHPLLEMLRQGSPMARAVRSLAIVPILYEDRPMGVLFLRATHTFAFGEHELALCRTVSNAMAIALRNARVLQSLRDQTQEVTVARFEAERRLRSLQRYADFFESAADGIVVLGVDGRLLFSNPKASEIMGYAGSELTGQLLGELFTPEDRHIAHELREGFEQGRYPTGIDVRVRRKDGAHLVLSLAFSSVLREETVVLCNFRDVTVDRAVAAELGTTKDLLQRIIDSSLDAIISADVHGRVLVFNRAAERIYGRPSEQMVGSDVRAIYAPGGAQRVMALIRAGGGRIEGVRTEIVDASGQTVPVSLSASLMKEDDRIEGTVGIFTDLRERMRMEARLAQAQEQLLAQERQSVIAELAGTAAHELNQPLTTVVMSAELLKRKLDPAAPVYGIAEVIHAEAERMADIVRKIGKITKYETKSYVGRARILDLDKSSEEPKSGPHPASPRDGRASEGNR